MIKPQETFPCGSELIGSKTRPNIAVLTTSNSFDKDWMSVAMSGSGSVLHTTDLKQIGSQQREKLTDFVVNLGIFTTPWHGFSDTTGIITNMP